MVKNRRSASSKFLHPDFPICGCHNTDRLSLTEKWPTYWFHSISLLEIKHLLIFWSYGPHLVVFKLQVGGIRKENKRSCMSYLYCSSVGLDPRPRWEVFAIDSSQSFYPNSKPWADLQVQVPSSGFETIKCGVCQHPFIMRAHWLIPVQTLFFMSLFARLSASRL